jgi:hypothetical protein
MDVKSCLIINSHPINARAAEERAPDHRLKESSKPNMTNPSPSYFRSDFVYYCLPGGSSRQPEQLTRRVVQARQTRLRPRLLSTPQVGPDHRSTSTLCTHNPLAVFFIG